MMIITTQADCRGASQQGGPEPGHRLMSGRLHFFHAGSVTGLIMFDCILGISPGLIED